ncbi:MAG: hypothetical protein PHC66_02860 [Candidatus Nanoarchaeia archaeon]|nr:hypothetical protein [Candidatus Nanoarchaeia archaeon]MDD5239003.1 hypothetical protein [Candidatus Nanoarchaeia archaeon]
MHDIIEKVGESEMCRCPKCGYAQPRLAGTPCRAIVCPKCKVPLR